MKIKDKIKESSTKAWDNAKENAADNRARKKRQKQERFLKTGEYIRDRKGKEKVNLIILRQKATGEIYFNDDEDTMYVIVDYLWQGPRVETITESVTTGTHKKKGRVGSALVGGAILGPVGAIAGASGSRKTNIKEKTTSKDKDIEKASRATIKFRSLENDLIISKDFIWTSDYDDDIKVFINEENFLNSTNQETLNYNTPIDPADQLRKYKSLLDDEIITQEEFDKKKKELLNL